MILTLTFSEAEQIIIEHLRPKYNLPSNASVVFDKEDKDVTISWTHDTIQKPTFPTTRRLDTTFGTFKPLLNQTSWALID